MWYACCHSLRANQETNKLISCPPSNLHPLHDSSENLGGFKVPPSGKRVITSGLLLLKSHIAVMLEGKAHNVRCNVVDVIARLPKTSSERSAVQKSNQSCTITVLGVTVPKQSACDFLG
jgi:hypothetical protein